MKNDDLAICSMVLGIIGIIFIFAPGLNFIGILCGILAIVFGIISKNRIAASAGALGGAGMAQAGFVLGIITIAFLVITLAACGALITSIFKL